MPDPTLPNAALMAGLYRELSEIFKAISQEEPDSFATLKYLLWFLKFLHKHADENRMNSTNLATIFWPIILRTDDTDPEFVSSFTQSLTDTVC